MNLVGKHPATIVSYSQETRLCLVDIEGISTGADEPLEADIMYPLGDKSNNTEIEILEGDLIWVEFQGGDPRYPIVVGNRVLNEGASTDGRRYWHNKNIHISADEEALITVGGEDDTRIKATPDVVRIQAGTVDDTVVIIDKGRISLKQGGADKTLIKATGSSAFIRVGDETGSEVNVTDSNITMKTGGDDKAFIEATDTKITATMGGVGDANVEVTAQKISAKLGLAEITVENNKILLKIGSNEFMITSTFSRMVSGVSILTLTPDGTTLVTPDFEATPS